MLKLLEVVIGARSKLKIAIAANGDTFIYYMIGNSNITYRLTEDELFMAITEYLDKRNTEVLSNG